MAGGQRAGAPRPADFHQLEWDRQLEDDSRQLIRLAVREDLSRWQDWTTLALIDPDAQGGAVLTARQSGQTAGLLLVPLILEEMNLRVAFQTAVRDGQPFAPGATLGQLKGNIRDLLTAERLILNLLSRLCGVATRTRAFVDAVQGTAARIYDTRKTTPGWRRLEKYAVRCGGGCNHRTGLFDAILIKDNHLAFAGLSSNPAQAVARARQFIADSAEHYPELRDLLIEVEVDHLSQLESVLAAGPDLVLLDNMTTEQLRAAVALRTRRQPACQLEASGRVTLETVEQIAATGVERISVGGLTHAAVAVDIGLDYQ
jgi:nicotinate-nucleotide pyrophosphorylase (carboxylating)